MCMHRVPAALNGSQQLASAILLQDAQMVLYSVLHRGIKQELWHVPGGILLVYVTSTLKLQDVDSFELLEVCRDGSSSCWLFANAWIKPAGAKADLCCRPAKY
jgi:hypothetical protein